MENSEKAKIQKFHTLEDAKNAFNKRFTEEEGAITYYKSPGRINLIGEHTDYNGGLSLPAPIDKGIFFAFCKLDSTEVSSSCQLECELFSEELDGYYKTTDTEKIGQKNFLTFDYIMGVLNRVFEILNEKNSPVNFRFKCTFGGNLPMGLGISSSSALTIGFAFALNHAYQLGFSKKELALIGQYSERNYIGVSGGLLDQTAILFGQKNSVLKIDFLKDLTDLIKVKTGSFSIILIDSNEERQLAESGYNDRTQECQKGLEILNENFNNSEQKLNFRDFTEEQYQEVMSKAGKDSFDYTALKRSYYVFKENLRVLALIEALEEEDWEKIGELVYASHEGLSKEFEVSTERLDKLVELTRGVEGVIGARMMGGGFGGCTLNLIKKGNEENFIEKMKDDFKQKYGFEPLCLLTEIDDGVKEI